MRAGSAATKGFSVRRERENRSGLPAHKSCCQQVPLVCVLSQQCIQAPELAALPWEYLVDNGRNPVALSQQTPLVRHLEMPSTATRLRLQPPVRILGMIGSSTGLDVPGEQLPMERRH